VSVTGAATAPSGGLGSVTFGFHLLEFPDIVVDWRGFALGGCPLLRLGCVSVTATRAYARPPGGLGSVIVIVIIVCPRNGPGVGIDWWGVTFGCPLLRSGCVSSTATRANARPPGGLAGLGVNDVHPCNGPGVVLSGRGVPCVRWQRVREVAEVRWGGPRLFRETDRKLEGPCIVGAIPPPQIGSLCCRGCGGGGRFFDWLRWSSRVWDALLGDSLAHDDQCHPDLLTGAMDCGLACGTCFIQRSGDRYAGLRNGGGQFEATPNLADEVANVRLGYPQL
jgi:hypothetical protein